MAITRTAMVDDDGSGTTGTIINNAWKTELYNQIDAANAAAGSTSGTWLPDLRTTTAAPVGQTYALREGIWMRSGNLVVIHGRITLTAIGTLTGATLAIGGLPVIGSPAMGTAGVLMFPYFGALAAAVTTLGGWVMVNTTACLLTYTAAPAVAAALASPALLTATTDVMFGGMYLTP
jgi:hypothetical protein